MTASAASKRAAVVSAAEPWTITAVQELGVMTDVETAGAIIGIGRTKAYQLAKCGAFPVPILRVGRRYLVPVSAILRLLQATDDISPS